MPSARSGARTRLLVVLAMVLVVGAGVVLYARSRSDGPSAAEVAERQSSCERLLRLSSLVADPAISPATPADPVRPEAVSNALTQMGGDLDALAGSSPTKVRTDVQSLVGALRAQPADPEIRSPAFSQARQRLERYLNEPENGCLPSGSGDG